MSDVRKWSVVVLIVILAALIVGLLPGTAMAQDAVDEGGGRPVVGYYIAVVICVGAVLWAVCRTSHR